VFRRGLVWLSILSAPAVAACSLLLDEGFSGNGPSPADSGTGPDTASSSGGDGSAHAERDGGLTFDATLPTVDGGKLVCADAAGIFCDDFERDDPQGGWSAVNLNEAGTLSIGKPSGASRRLEAAIVGADGFAQLSKDFTLTPTKMHIEVTLELLGLPSAGASLIVGTTMLNPGNPVSLFYLYAHGGGSFVVEQLTDGTHYVQTPVALTLNAPHRVIMEVEQGGKMTVSVDGVLQVDKTTEPWLVLKPPSAYVGPGSINGGNTFSMRADDYVFVAE
jgi:hypothetical protein